MERRPSSASGKNRCRISFSLMCGRRKFLASFPIPWLIRPRRICGLCCREIIDSKPCSGLTKSWSLLNNKGFKRAFSCGRYHCQSAQAAGPGTHFHVYDWLPRWPRFPCTPNSLAPVLSRRSSVSLTSSAKIDEYCLPARPAARILA